MDYEKRTWVPGVTKCSAENFNHMEDGIETAQKGVDELNTNIHTVDLAVSPNIGVNVYDAFTIPALKIAVVSLMIPAANVGAGMIMCGIDVVPSKSSYAALNGYSGKDGQVYVTPGNMAIYCDSSSNNGDGRATLVFRYR